MDEPEVTYGFYADNSFYLSYSLDNAVLAAFYHDVSVLAVETRQYILSSEHLWCTVGRVDIRVSVLEKSNGDIGQVLICQHRRDNDVFDMLIIFSGPLWSNVSLTWLSIPG